VALIAYGSNQATASGKLVQTSRPPVHEAPYKPLRPISSYALAAARHMNRYGTTKRQLAEVAVAARRWAQLNPEAVARDDLTLDAVVNARMVSDPLGTRDCCLVTDGAAAVVMIRAGRAADQHMHPVYLLGTAAAVTHADIAAMPDLTITGAGMFGLFTVVESVRQLRGEAGERQVKGAALALAHGNGGVLSSQATAIFGTGDTL
jgi:acetyl-CoA acetyltransferase